MLGAFAPRRAWQATNVRRFLAFCLPTVILIPVLSSSEGPAGWLIPFIGPWRVGADIGVTGEPEVDDFARLTATSRLRVHPWFDAHNEVVLSGTWQRAWIDTGHTFANGQPLPDRLQATTANVLYRHVADDGVIFGVDAAVTSSDRDPFSSGVGTSVSAAAFVRLPRGRNAWILSLVYLESSPVLGGVPLPGVLYQWNPRRELQVLVGVPLMFVRWQASAQTSITAFATMFGTARIDGNFTPLPEQSWWQVTATIAYESESYGWPTELAEDEEVIFSAARATIGTRAKWPRLGEVELFGGWQAARRVIIGTSLFDRETELVVDPGPILGLKASFRF